MYVLGYTIAAISITGSAKSQVGASILIPILALGVPLFDTIISPLRRFIRGRRMFQPDKSHIHHRMLELGLNTRRVVLTFYAFTALLCISAIVVVNLRDEQAGLFLSIIGAGGVLAIRKLGYFNYLKSDKLLSWVRDLSDQTGFSFSRRSFLDLQLKIEASNSHDELWANSTQAFDKLHFDFGEMNLYERARPYQVVPSREFQLAPSRDIAPQCAITEDGAARTYTWSREKGVSQDRLICESCLFKLELPLISCKRGIHFGTLWLVKDLNNDPISHYTIQRIEHYRRSVIRALIKLQDQQDVLVQEAPIREKEQPARILVVDDDAMSLRLLEKVFMKNGYNVLVAPDGESAIEKAREAVVDAAVVDLQMPNMDGIELCSKLKGIHPRTKILATTGYATQYQSETCYKAGFDGYFPKPIIPHELMNVVKIILKANRSSI